MGGRDWMRDVEGWKYYNHAAVPTCAPHEIPDLTPINDGRIWKIGGVPLFARWTDHYDCKEETEWWYCILDSPFDISKLKSNRRYKINKGNRLFEVKEIKPLDYRDELMRVQIAAFSAYPEKYRPIVDREDFYIYLKKCNDEIQEGKSLFYGAFFKETNELCGYHIVSLGNGFRGCNVLKTDPEFEKYQINAALVYKWVTDAEEFIKAGGYLQNGTRTINHETAFQDYLEYYFGFRKAYCRLRIKYRPFMRVMIVVLRFFQNMLEKHDNVGIIHSINAVLKMDEIVREKKV